MRQNAKNIAHQVLTCRATTDNMRPFNHSCFHQFPVLRTKRLTLRDIRQEDAVEIFRMRASGVVNRFIARDDMTELSSAEKLVNTVQERYTSQSAIAWAGILREQEGIIGTCGLRNIEKDNARAELGGELATAYWGKHLAIEAVSAIVHFGLSTMNLHSIEARVAPENRGAIALLESLGFNKEAHYRDRIFYNGKFLDMAVYTIIAQ
jgi:[ribosomal protein S5]-alanine N-acetyltransferase